MNITDKEIKQAITDIEVSGDTCFSFTKETMLCLLSEILFLRHPFDSMIQKFKKYYTRR